MISVLSFVTMSFGVAAGKYTPNQMSTSMSRMPAASPSEGTLGVALERLVPLAESITMRPACTLVSAWWIGMKTALIWPPRMPVIMPSEPL